MDIASFCKMLPDKVDEKFDRKCSEIAQEIFKGNATIVDLIEQLRPYLTNIDPTQRELGVLALTIVLESLPIDFLNAQQIKVLATFYADILKGHHVILPTVFKGILRIIQFKHFPEEVIPTLLNTFLQNVACQQQQQADRYSIYCIFQNMFDLYRTALLSMGMDFVYVVITSIDGERDPRNLVFLFKWLQRFLQHVSLGHLSEEMFEVLACYFPVDFKAPPSESAITRDMLSEALSPCLCSRSEFGEFAIPLALEKLDSSLNIAKLDSLKLLKDGCDHFPAPVYIENFQKIWNQLHKELFTTSSNEIRSLCLETLTAVVKRTSTDPVHYVKVKPMLQDICDTVKGNLLPDSKLFEPSADILLHIARGSQHSSALVIKEIVPFLTNTINITSTSPHKEKLMKYLLEFTIAYLTFHDRLSDELNDVPMIFLKAAVEGDRMLQERGYDYLGQIARHLPTEVRAVVYNNIHTLIINNDVVMLDCLKGLAEAYPDEVNASIFHKTELNSVPAVTTYLNSLSYLINLPRFTEMVVANLLGYFQKPEYTTIAVDCMRSLLVTKQMNNNVLAEFISNDAVDKLVRFSLEQTADEGMLLKISEIMKILIGLQDSDVQENILQMHLERIQSQLKQRELTVILLDGLLLRLNRDVRISYDVLDVLLNMAMESRSETVIDTCVKLLANLLNKKDNDENFHSYVEKAKEKCLEAISTRKDTALSLLVWFTKALLMKNYPDCFTWADLLLMLLDQYPELGSYLKIIMNSSYECLSDTSHCNCMPLYRQKFFVYVTNKIADRLDNVVYLKVVGHLIEYAPEQAVQFQFKKIRKMILMCLEKCSEPPVLCVLLRCIKRIVKDDSEAVESSLDDFLLRVLKLTTFKDSLDVRMEALQCLSVMTVAFPVYKLLPHKNTVIHHLAACTDDRKRLVRKEAMDARSLWFLLDAPV